MARMMADCRRCSETNCSLAMIGEEDEVVRAAGKWQSAQPATTGAER